MRQGAAAQRLSTATGTARALVQSVAMRGEARLLRALGLVLFCVTANFQGAHCIISGGGNGGHGGGVGGGHAGGAGHAGERTATAAEGEFQRGGFFF